LPTAQARVPMKKNTAGTTIAELDAIRPNTPMPVRYDSPEAPSSAKAVIWVPNSDISRTKGPIERVARK